MMLQRWKTLKELILVLKIPYDATIALQNANITLSDVYGIWTKMKLHLEACTQKESYKSKLSQNLVQCLEWKHDIIFKNPKMECCLFLDPRFRRVILSDREAVERTRANLLDLHRHLMSLKNANPIPIDLSNASSDLHLSFDAQNALNQLMSTRDMANPDDISMNIEDAIDLFQPEILSSEKSVLEYWESEKKSILYDLAMSIYSIPPTQARVERDFSSVSHIFTERRYQLQQERLEKILLIHFNKDIFFAIKQDILKE